MTQNADSGSLMERRAEFVYEAARLAAVAAAAPVIPATWTDREDAFRSQFLDVIERQCGPSRSASPEELHGSWVQAYIDMGWHFGEVYDPEAKTHPDMVPYAQLGQLEQDKDSVFVALCEIARQWIRGCPANADGKCRPDYHNGVCLDCGSPAGVPPVGRSAP
ncbi:MAG TPA: RyR domain-containing protein [Acidimicrobiales bacterium]|nr:RyR domain-containing protein [Acidimicrobiales bacterium]